MSDTYRAEFGGLLKGFRERRNLSQSKLAERAAFDHSYCSRLESGARMPTRDAVDRLAKAMGLDEIETERLLQSAGFLGNRESPVSYEMLHEARSHLASALALLGGAVGG